MPPSPLHIVIKCRNFFTTHFTANFTTNHYHYPPPTPPQHLMYQRETQLKVLRGLQRFWGGCKYLARIIEQQESGHFGSSPLMKARTAKYLYLLHGEGGIPYFYCCTTKAGVEQGRGILWVLWVQPKACRTWFKLYYFNPTMASINDTYIVFGYYTQSCWTDPDSSVVSLPWPVIMYHIISCIQVQVLLHWVVSVFLNPPKSSLCAMDDRFLHWPRPGKRPWFQW